MSISTVIQRAIPQIPRRRRLALGIVLHAIFPMISLYVALLLRLDLDASRISYESFWGWVPVLIALRVVALMYFQAHTGLWRYVSIPDLIGVIKSTTLSTIIFTILLAMVADFEGIPRSVPAIEWGVHIFLAGGLRILTRVVREKYHTSNTNHPSNRRVIIVGAGSAAAARGGPWRCRRRW